MFLIPEREILLDELSFSFSNGFGGCESTLLEIPVIGIIVFVFGRVCWFIELRPGDRVCCR